MIINYKKIYKEASKRGGWSSKTPERLTKWGDIYVNFSKKLKGTESVLDIGTGEGNRFLNIAKKVRLGIGIDTEPGMIALAKKNSRKLKNIKFKLMDAKHLKFKPETFDLITCRQAPFSPDEACRVLKPKGLFVTQQLYETDKSNLQKTFKRGQTYGERPGTLLKLYITESKLAGFRVLKREVSDLPFYFKDRIRLVGYLKRYPTIPNFGSKKDYKVLEKFIKQNKTKKGIKSNSARFLLVLEKRIR